MTAELIMTVEEMKDRNKWLNMRMEGIGGSDAGIIVGLNKYKSAFSLWLEKTGQVEPEDLSDNEKIYWGNVLEEAVARRFSEVTGKKVQRRGMMRSVAYPFMFANVDRMVVGEDAGLEIKTAGTFQAAKWEGDEIPDTYYCQCQHYMAVTGYKKWYIAVLIGGNHFVWKEVLRNDDDIEALIAAEKTFWEMVQNKDMPDVDWTENCQAALAERFSGKKQEDALYLPAEAEAILKEYDELDAAKKEVEQAIQLKKNQLCLLLGEYETGYVGERKITWKEQAGRESVDLKAIKKNDTELFQRLADGKYIKVSKASRPLRIGKGA